MTQSPPQSALRQIPSLRWWIVALLLLATTINYMDRHTISVAIPVIRQELKRSAIDYSWIVFWFLLAYAVMQILAGKFIDRVGTRRGFTILIVWWSVALFTLLADVVSAADVAYVRGLSGAAGSLGARCFTPVVRWLIPHVSSAPVFWIVAAMHLVSALLVELFLPTIQPVKPSIST